MNRNLLNVRGLAVLLVWLLTIPGALRSHAGITTNGRLSSANIDGRGWAVNTAPTDIQLSSTSVAENQASGATVGSFTSTDADVPAQTFTYSLVAGLGSTDNASFQVVGSQLRTSAVFDYETRNSYSIRVRTTDNGSPSLSYEEAFTVTVTDVNENVTITDGNAAANTVAENAANGTSVGVRASAPFIPNASSPFYSFLNSAGGCFAINGSTGDVTVANGALLDYQTATSYTITVQVGYVLTAGYYGNYGGVQTFTINITNVNEAPTANNDAVTVITNSGATVVSVLTNDSDPDAGTTLTVTAVTQPANGAVTLTGGVVRFTPSANFSGTTTFTYTISDGTLTATATVTVSVTPANNECAGAIALTSTPNCVGTSGSVAGATQSRAPSSCSNFTAPTANDVWYSFVATGPSHSVQASSAFDGVLEVFSGSCGSLASLGCSDQHVENSSETFNMTTLTAGTTYYVRYYPYTNIANTSFSICVTGAAPTATITSTATSPTSTNPIPMTVTFSLAVTGFTAADVTVGNGVLSGFTAVNATTYTFTVTPANNGAVTVDVAANAAQDLANNGNTAATQFSITFAFPTTNWTGAVSTDWFNAGNWSAGVPTPTTDAVLSLISGWTPFINSGTASAHSCTVGGSYYLTLQGGTLDLKGNFTINGSFSMSSNTQVVLSGTSPQTIGGSVTPQLYNLTVGVAGATLTGNITMLQLLTLNGGLATGSYKVTLNASATLSETETNYVTGAVEATRTLSTAGTGNSFGGLGLVLTPAAASTVLPGSTLVRRVTGTTTTGVSGNQGLKRYFVVTPAVDVNLNVTMDLSYFDHDLPSGINEARLAFFKSATNGATGPWALVGVSTRSVGTNTMTKTGITSLSTWTLGSLDTPLPVELLAFTAERQGEDALLSWATASEKNSAYFAVESSLDGREFRPVGQVPGHGTSTQRQDYQFRDANLARYAAGQLYYRLRQVDQDGTESYSPIRSIQVPATSALAVEAYPNPYQEAVRLTIRTGAAGPATLSLTNAQGQLVLQREVQLPAGVSALALDDATRLPSGLYVLRVQQGKQQQSLKLVRK